MALPHHKSLPRRTVLEGARHHFGAAVPGRDATPAPRRRKARAPLPGLLRPERDGHGILDSHGRRQILRASRPSWSRWPPTKIQRCLCSPPASRRAWNYIHAGASGSFLTGTPPRGRPQRNRNHRRRLHRPDARQATSRRKRNCRRLKCPWTSWPTPAPAPAIWKACAYLDTLSWRSPTQPLPMDWNPRTVFEKLFGDSGSTNSEALERRRKQHKRHSSIPSTES